MSMKAQPRSPHAGLARVSSRWGAPGGFLGPGGPASIAACPSGLRDGAGRGPLSSVPSRTILIVARPALGLGPRMLRPAHSRAPGRGQVKVAEQHGGGGFRNRTVCPRALAACQVVNKEAGRMSPCAWRAECGHC